MVASGKLSKALRAVAGPDQATGEDDLTTLLKLMEVCKFVDYSTNHAWAVLVLCHEIIAYFVPLCTYMKCRRREKG